MKRVECGWCAKIVRDKPILGTRHICVGAKRRAEMVANVAKINAQFAEIRRLQSEMGGSLDRIARMHGIGRLYDRRH